MVAILLLLVIVLGVPVAAQATSAKDKAKQTFENMQKQDDEELNEVMNLPDQKSTNGDPEAAIDSMTYNILVWWYALQKGIRKIAIPLVLTSLVFGYLVTLAYRKDKFKQKWGYGIMIAIPICVFIIIYGPAITSIFESH